MAHTYLSSLNSFITTPLDDLLTYPHCGDTEPHIAVSAAESLAQEAISEVPAYKKHVGDAAVGGGDMATKEGKIPFKSLPITSKPNYITVHPISDRSWGGSIYSSDFMHFSSGSSGEPTFWGRGPEDEISIAVRFEQIFRDNFSTHTTPTLAIICFPLGGWVGGLFTTLCVRYLSHKGYMVTLVTPGNKMDEILKFASQIGPKFKQTVLLGYPPFVKGVIDAGVAAGITWRNLNVRLVLAGEVFSERWRDLVCERTGIIPNSEEALKAVVSIYGTADAGVLACETVLSVRLRRWLNQNVNVARELFRRDRLPTIAQYDPCSRLLEIHPDDQTLVITSLPGVREMHGNSGNLQRENEIVGEKERRGAPVIRYCIGDAGGVMSFDNMMKFATERGFLLTQDEKSMLEDGKSACVGENGSVVVRHLPFVWVFGRAFWMVSLYGANVYVENIMSGLEHPQVRKFVTGRFVLRVEELKDMEEILCVRVELAEGVYERRDGTGSGVEEGNVEMGKDLGSVVVGGVDWGIEIAKIVRAELVRVNSEYTNYVPAERQTPLVKLYRFGDPCYFPIGVKHKYT